MFDFIKVKAIGVTQPLVDFIPDSEGIISYAARVSAPQNQTNFDTADKLLGYCAKHAHWSVFETCSITMEIEAPRDICRQILRHRSFSFQEFCVASGTKISTVVGGTVKKVKIEDLYKRFKSKQYWSKSENLVRVFDENTGMLTSAKIKEVFDTGIKPVYRLTLDNGKTIDATAEHKFLTKEGFKKLADITDNDFVGCNGVPIYQTLEWLYEAKIEAIENGTGVQGMAEKAGVSYHTIRKWLRKNNLQFTKAQVAMYTDAWNKGASRESQPRYGKTVSESTRDRMRFSSKKGENCVLFSSGKRRPFALGVRDYWYKRKNYLFKKFKGICAKSGKVCGYDDISIDHILPLSKFPEKAYDEDNIQILSKKEHFAKSAKETSVRGLTASWHKVVSVEFVGELQTYDMEIEHSSHNYVANGIITHNSQRYAEATDFCTREARLQDHKNRQNSIKAPTETEDDKFLISEWERRQQEVLEIVNDHYNWAINCGIAKECARVLLPEGLTMSKMYMQGSVRSWMHYINLRKENGTQLEHCDVAWKVREEFVKLFPSLEKYV